MDSDKLLNLATSLGCLLAESGAEISRVEESVYRLLQAYQGKDAQVFAHPQLFDCQFDGGGWPSGDPDAPDQCPRHGSGATGELQRFMPPALPYRTAPGRGPGHGGPPPCLLPPPPPRHGAAGLRYRPRFLLSPVRRRVLGQLERLLLRSGGGHLPALRRQMAGQQQLSADAGMQRHRLPAVSSAGAGGSWDQCGPGDHRRPDAAGAGRGPDQRHAGDRGRRHYSGLSRTAELF